MKQSTTVTILAIVILASASFLVYKFLYTAPSTVPIDISDNNENNQNTNTNTNTPVACSEEAMVCPDGSVVSRTGPNCKFALCPNTGIKQETIASLNQKIFTGGIYLTPLKVVSDSRCAVDAVCFWAGEVVVKVRLEKSGVIKEVEFKEGETVAFEGSDVSLVNVTPENNTKTTIKLPDYKFIFKVNTI